jgi:hypothetical protein
MTKKLSARQAAKQLSQQLLEDGCQPSATTLQKWISNESENYSQKFADLNNEQQAKVISTVKDKAIKHNENKDNRRSDCISRIHKKLLANGHQREKKGVQTRFDRLLDDRKTKWDKLSQEEKIAFEQEVFKLIVETDTEGSRTTKTCFLDNKEIGPIKHLHAHLAQKGYSINKPGTFSKLLREHFKANKQNQIFITSGDIAKYLTKSPTNYSFKNPKFAEEIFADSTIKYCVDSILIGNNYDMHNHIVQSINPEITFAQFADILCIHVSKNKQNFILLSERLLKQIFTSTTGHVKTPAVKKNTKRHFELELLLTLREEGLDVALSTIQSWCTDLLKREKTSWASLDREELSSFKKLVETTIRNTDRKSPTYWTIEIDNKTHVLTSPQLHKHVKENANGKRILSYQRFLQVLRQINKQDDIHTVINHKINSLEGLIENIFKVASTLPCVIYQLEVKAGDAKGKIYVGQTQKTVAQRVALHIKDTSRKQYEKSTRKMHKAIRSALEHTAEGNVFKITILEKDVNPDEVEARENYFINQIPEQLKLNSIQGGSFGGSCGNPTVVYESETDTLAKTMLKAARNHNLTENTSEKFQMRAKIRYHKNNNDVYEAIAFALAGVGGRKGRSDDLKFNVGGVQMTSPQIVESDTFDKIKNRSQLDELMKRHSTRTNVSERNIDIRPWLTGEIALLRPQTPDFQHLREYATEEVLELTEPDELKNYTTLGKAIGKRKHSMVWRAQHHSVERFWQDIGNELRKQRQPRAS